MARKINLSESEKALIKQKNAERRDHLYHLPQSKYNISESDMSEAMEPLSQVTDIISRLRSQNSSTNSSSQGYDQQYSAEKVALLDNVTSSESLQDKHFSSLLDNVTSPVSHQETLYPISEEVTSPQSNANATSHLIAETQFLDDSISLKYNPLSSVSAPLETNTVHSNETSTSSLSYSDTVTSISNDPAERPFQEKQKFALIQSIFLNEKDLSNVERNFMVSLFLEMSCHAERLSINNIIKKYDFRKATVYQIIPHIANMGLIQIVTDNSPKGSLIDITRLLTKYNIPLCYQNESSSTNQLVNNKNNSNTYLTNTPGLNENVSTFKLDPTRRMLVKNSILYLFRSMMMIDAFRKIEVYNEKSIKIFAEYLIKHNVSHEAQIDLLGLAIYSAEKTKKSERIIYYLHNTLENGGIESLQIAFKEKAEDFLDLSNQFYEIDFEEPSLKEIKDFCKQLGIPEEQPRTLLVSNLVKCRKEIEENMIIVDRIIETMPEFKR